MASSPILQREPASESSQIAMDETATLPNVPMIDQHILAMAGARDLESLYPRISPSDLGCDTAVFIDPPPRDSDFPEDFYEIVRRHYDAVFPAKSAVLKRSSPSYLAPMFEPTKQKRLVQKLGSRLHLSSSFQPKYVINLTPADEGEEAVVTLTDLHCPDAVRLWHLSKIRFKCPQQLVWDTSEFSSFKVVRTGSIFNQADDNRPRVAPYTKLRHHRAIERLLLMLHEREVDLNSAVKVYTTAGVAHHLQITHSPFNDFVVNWIYHPQNRFLQVAPEACLQIADWLKLGYVARDAFAILVGEAALDRAAGNTTREMTWHKRKRAEINETWQTRIQYAQESFEQRVNVCFESLVDPTMQWVAQLPEAIKLVTLQDSLSPCDPTYLVVQELSETLMRMVRWSIFNVLCADLVWMHGDEACMSMDARDLHPDVNVTARYNALPVKSRHFTAVFWSVLSTLDLPGMLRQPLSFGRKARFGFEVAEMKTGSMTSCAKLTEAGFQQDMDKDWIREIAQKIHEVALRTTSNKESAGKPQHLSQDLAIRQRTSNFEKPPVHEHIPERSSREELAMSVPIHTISSTQQYDSWDATYDNPSQIPPRYTWMSNQVPTKQVMEDSSAWSSSLENNTLSLPSSQIEPTGSANSLLSEALPSSAPLDLVQFLREVEQALSSQAKSMLHHPSEGPSVERDYTLTNVLVCLDQDEVQCLPLWADGNDDGTGGVFAAPIIASDDNLDYSRNFLNVAESDFDMVSFSNSEVPTSCIVHDGRSTVLDRRRVYAASETGSFDSFDMVEGKDAGQSEDEVISIASDTPTITKMGDDYTDIFMNSADSDGEEDQFAEEE